MKRQNPTHPRGVALLLILGLMAMFALAILSYLMVTSNMAETAQNAQKVEQKKSLEVNPEHDIDHALKTLVIGSTNQSNPIAPLSILENMYGNWSESKYNNDGTWGSFHDATFVARVMLLPSRGFALVVPTEDYYGNALGGNLSALRDFYKSIFEDSGNVLTFTSIDAEGSLDDDDVNLWNTCVTGSSAFIDEKVITDPVNFDYQGSDGYCFNTYAPNGADGFEIIAGGDYGDFDFWHFKVDITDEMKRFASKCNNSLADFNNDANFLVTVRLNHPAYSGSGVGGFSPGELKDSSFTPDQIAAVPQFAGLTIPFAYWTNPSAPDFMPFVLDSNSKPSFRSFWAHLTDVNYRVDVTNRYAQLNGAQWSYNNYVTDGNSAGDPLFQTRINPAYTAPDYRSLFLAHFDGVMAPNSITPNPPYAMITPSFHRPQLFAAYVNYLGYYAGSGYNDQKFSALIRKLTPRPLPNDHWHFDGGNSALSVYEMNGGNYSQPNYQDVVERLAGTDAGGNQMQWDVDNDGDGVREGIWVPTGLPIRYDANGTPFATMASYTIVDLDGRINVNTAGNWDQLPNKLATENRQDSDGNVYSSSARPYDNLNELVDVINATGSSLVGTPFFNVENLRDPYSIFNWLNEKNVYESGMIRGDGLGASNVRLYDVLLWIFTTESDNQVAVTASNLLWRRYLPTNQDPYLYTLTQDTINGGNTYNLSWDQNGISDAIRSGAPSDVVIVSSVPQPGVDVDQNPTDPNPNLVDVFGDADNNDENAEYLFRYFRPMQLFAPRNALAITRDTFDETDTATFGAARVLYPWRGKTTLDMSSSVKNRYFDFANSALRSYDPLGAQLFTYAPNYTRNPYRAYQNATSRNDSGYTLAMLERLLRSYDVDAPSLPAQLLKDLGLDGTIYQNQNRELDAARARQALTTLSSDVPAAAVVFPEKYKTNTGNDVQDTRYGDFGFASLVRKAVETELIRAINNKSFDDLADQQVANGVFPTKEEAQAYIRTKIIYDPSGNGLSDALNDKIEEITAYLVAMLPKEIMRGEKIDLNALTQKNYWVDVDYLNNGNPTDLADYYDDREGDRTTHNLGLVKRMEFARGLYLVIMTLVYEDMNAHDVYGDPNPSLYGDATVDDYGNTTSNKALDDRVSNYIEGSLEDLLGFTRGEQDLLQRELMATRIAQWCVNAVDFADPDATMTPFFFDPTPFDGWWVVWNEDWFTEVYATGASSNAFHLFDPANGDVRLQIEDFFREAIDGSSETNSGATSFVNASLSFDSSKRSNQLVAEWMTRKIDKLEDQTTDLGFRLVWGMERPDLVLTETLNWHDLGIADTEFEEKSVVFGGEAKKRGGDDGDPT
ncbi:MAG: hypothetical protein Q4G03_06210, partial [Planctomycetia bacterium]|nr:hypothetical protein [Planctomycetia bacterium]